VNVCSAGIGILCPLASGYFITSTCWKRIKNNFASR